MQCFPPGVDHSVLKPLQKHVDVTVPTKPACVLLFNTQSLTNKSALNHDFISDDSFDLICLTKTWHKDGDYFHLNEASPQGYKYIRNVHFRSHIDGIAVLCKNSISLQPLTVPELQSFDRLASTCPHLPNSQLSLSTTHLNLNNPSSQNFSIS